MHNMLIDPKTCQVVQALLVDCQGAHVSAILSHFERLRAVYFLIFFALWHFRSVFNVLFLYLNRPLFLDTTQ